MNPPQATRLQPVVRRVCPPVETVDDKNTHIYRRTLASGILWLFFGNGDVRGWQGKRTRPCWKTSTEWPRRETVANPAAGIAPSAPTRSLGISQCGSTESRATHSWGALSTPDRNGSLGANGVGERHALPRSCTTFSGGRAFTPTRPLPRKEELTVISLPRLVDAGRGLAAPRPGSFRGRRRRRSRGRRVAPGPRPGLALGTPGFGAAAGRCPFACL